MGKTCAACEQRLPVSAFHRRSDRPDGLQSRCKSCIKAYQDASPSFRENTRRNARRYAEQKRDAKRAHQAVARAVKSGRLERPETCSECGVAAQLDGHHHRGYDHPLDVQWLCRSCHVTIEPRRGVAA